MSGMTDLDSRPAVPMVDQETFAAIHDVDVRTVRRWLAADRISGAVKLGGRWNIPRDAAVREDPGQDMRVLVHDWAASRTARVTVAAVLDTLPVLVPLDTAAELLGTTVHAMRGNPDYFHLCRLGPRGRYAMPKYRIRQLDGSAGATA